MPLIISSPAGTSSPLAGEVIFIVGIVMVVDTVCSCP